MIVLVLGASGNPAANVARCLNAAGHTVIGADPDDSLFDLFPGSECVRLKSSLSPARIGELNGIIVDRGVDVVIAQPEPEVEWLAEYGGLVDAWTCLPQPQVVRLCRDKLKCARVLGDLAPRTVPTDDAMRLIQTGEMAQQVWLRAREGAGSYAALLAMYIDEVRPWHNVWANRGVEIIAADALPGDDYSWSGVYDRGVLVASGQMRRIKLLGASRGHSSTAQVQETTNRRDVAERAHAAILLAHQGALPNGAFKVDVREDAQGCPMVTEINAGRFGTTVDHYLAAGVNLPDALVRIYSEGIDGAFYAKAEPGVRWCRNTDALAMSPNPVVAA